MGAEPSGVAIEADWTASQATCGLGDAAPRRAEAAAPLPDHRISMPVVLRVVAVLDAVLIVGVAASVALPAGAGLPYGQWAVCLAFLLYVASGALRALSAYRLAPLSRLAVAVRDAGAATVCGTGGLALVVWLIGGGIGAWIPLAGASVFLALATSRLVLCLLLALWRATGQLARNVAVVGANDYSRSFIETVRQDPSGGLAIVGVYDDRLSRVPGDLGLPIGTVATLVQDARRRRIDVIVVALPLSATERIAQIRQQLASTVTDIFLTTDTAGLRYDGRDFETLGRNGVIRVGSRPLSDWDQMLKAGFDRLAALALLLLLSPLLLGVAAMIRLDSPGRVLFRQPRTGFNNRDFTVLKFRTMYSHMADLKADRQTTKNDPRVTRLGAFLRRSSIDELPQLLNVLRGDMSLVGPRPHAPNTKAANRYFDEVVADYALRHRIKPGITGWAQVNGWRGETQHVAQIEQRVAFDLAYIENWSLLLDVKILFMTAFGGFGGKNAY